MSTPRCASSVHATADARAATRFGAVLISCRGQEERRRKRGKEKEEGKKKGGREKSDTRSHTLETYRILHAVDAVSHLFHSSVEVVGRSGRR